MKRLPSISFLAALALLAVHANAQAQSYPAKPIRMVVGFPPGGGTDVVARRLTASVPHLVTVPPSLPVQSVKALIVFVKARPGKLSFPSAGNETVTRTPADFAAIVRADTARYAKIVKQANLRID